MARFFVRVMVLPRITTALPVSVAAGATLTLNVAPDVGRRQRVALLVGDTLIVQEGWPGGNASTTAQLEFEITAGMTPGSYLVQLRVDGATSRLSVDGSGTYDGPTINVT